MMLRLLSLSALTAELSQSYTVVDQGDHYKGKYIQGDWNYNFSQSISPPCPSSCSPENKCGPHCWGMVTPKIGETNMCGGSQQTPIEISQVDVNPSLMYPTFTAVDGGCTNWQQYADDNAFNVDFSYPDNLCDKLNAEYASASYTLAGFHFHAPAEHSVGGGLADAEIHMVHKSTSGHLLVVGVLLKESTAQNAFLKKFWSAVDASEQSYPLEYNKTNLNGGLPIPTKFSYEYSINDFPIPVNPYKEILPASKNFFTYEGSLTTYPCSEGVTWIVFEEPVYIGKEDLLNLRSAVACEQNSITLEDFLYSDNRPVVPLNGRVVQKYQFATPSDEDDTNSYADMLTIFIYIAGVTAIIMTMNLLAIFYGRRHNDHGEVQYRYLKSPLVEDDTSSIGERDV